MKILLIAHVLASGEYFMDIKIEDSIIQALRIPAKTAEILIQELDFTREGNPDNDTIKTTINYSA